MRNNCRSLHRILFSKFNQIFLLHLKTPLSFNENFDIDDKSGRREFKSDDKKLRMKEITKSYSESFYII